MITFAQKVIAYSICLILGVSVIGSLDVKLLMPSSAFAKTEQTTPNQQIEKMIGQYRKTLPQRGDPDTVILDVEVKNKVINWTILYEGIVDPNFNKSKFTSATKLETAFINCQFKAKRNVLNIGYTHTQTYYSEDGEELFNFTISKSDCPNTDFKNIKVIANDYVVKLSKLLPMETEIGGLVLSVQLKSNEMIFTYQDNLIQHSQFSKIQQKSLTETLKPYNCSKHLRHFFIKNGIEIREIFLNSNEKKFTEILTKRSDCLS